MKKTVAQYVAALEPGTREAVEKIRAIAAKEIGGEESISYGVIGIKRDGRPVMYVGGYAKHVSIYPIPTGDRDFEEAIAPFRAGKGTLKFSLAEELPIELIREIVRAHARK